MTFILLACSSRAYGRPSKCQGNIPEEWDGRRPVFMRVAVVVAGQKRWGDVEHPTRKGRGMRFRDSPLRCTNTFAFLTPPRRYVKLVSCIGPFPRWRSCLRKQLDRGGYPDFLDEILMFPWRVQHSDAIRIGLDALELAGATPSSLETHGCRLFSLPSLVQHLMIGQCFCSSSIDRFQFSHESFLISLLSIFKQLYVDFRRRTTSCCSWEFVT